MLLNDVYLKGEYPCDAENKRKLLEIFRAFPAEEPTRKRFVSEMVAWSAKFGELDRGDAEIHHEVGSVYAEGRFARRTHVYPWLACEYGIADRCDIEGEAYDAERHLVLGTAKSPPVLVSLHYSWYTTDQPHLAAIYASRSVLPYLLVGNLASANAALSAFTSKLTTSNPALLAMSQPLESSKSALSLRIFPSIPLLNFLSLLLLAAQKADSSLFKQLAKYYAPHLKEVEALWGEPLAHVGEAWFGIKIPRQGGNPLFDMMGSMLFSGAKPGGTPRSGTPKPATPVTKKEIEKPAAMDLD
jgi:golgi to ER traffic protein 4